MKKPPANKIIMGAGIWGIMLLSVTPASVWTPFTPIILASVMLAMAYLGLKQR